MKFVWLPTVTSINTGVVQEFTPVNMDRQAGNGSGEPPLDMAAEYKGPDGKSTSERRGGRFRRRPASGDLPSRLKAEARRRRHAEERRAGVDAAVS